MGMARFRRSILSDVDIGHVLADGSPLNISIVAASSITLQPTFDVYPGAQREELVNVVAEVCEGLAAGFGVRGAGLGVAVLPVLQRAGGAGQSLHNSFYFPAWRSGTQVDTGQSSHLKLK